MVKSKGFPCKRGTSVAAARAVATKAVESMFSGLYSVNFTNCTFEGLPHFEARLRRPDGEKVWAVVKGNRVKLTWRAGDRFADRIVTVGR